MEVLVTGATGRVGGNVVKVLRERGYEVRAMVMSGDKATSKVIQFGAKVVEGDLRNYKDCVKAVKNVDAVIHLGAYMPNILNVDDTRGVEERVRTLFDVNVGGTFNILEAIARHTQGCKRFVFASTGAVYPEGRHLYTPIDEYHPRHPVGMYAYSKLAGEELCWAYQREYGIPAVVCRFAYVIGAGEILNKYYYPGFWATRILDQLKKTKDARPEVAAAIDTIEREMKGDDCLVVGLDSKGRGYKSSIVDVRDLVQGILLTLEKDSAIGEAFNLAGPAPIYFPEIVPYISKKTGIRYITVTLPWEQRNCELSIAKAKSLLGYNPQYDAFKMVDSAILFQKGLDSTIVDRLQPRV
ncbi:SDR family NAD(P)-dependent oxidoreductase [Candidatus Bathyarchaeota archaeon]|nr:SDR family NAD(P)-dependent oxidoreductase [Candidatus Bathyarchaeota archaeon]